ncbi:conserved exported hypothetical protein [Tenacibaculum sp. 190524A02b]|uniref:Uncharacterized protein n=1 Tax=Tenacibaculum vairaonense TaxID=3137860 RepID=A0ABM9PSC0_9FLAO
MKRILFIALVLVATLYNVNIQAQQRGHGSTGIDIPIKPDDPNGPGGPGTPIPDPIPDPNPDDKVPDEFIGGDVKGGGGLGGIAIPCDCPEDPNYKDVSFELANDLASLITNEQRAKRAWDARQAKWFQRQKEKVVKPAIEKLYGKQYPSFEAAKNALFINSEKDMFRRHSFEVKRKYNTEKKNLAPKNSTYLKELKALLYRKKEIESGNINNSFYADFKVQGTLIKNIKNLSTINSFRANIFNKFKPNEGRLHFVRDMVKMLYSGMENTSKYKNQLYDLKQNLYKQTGDYMNKIDLLQFVYMQEMFKKNMLNNPVNSYQNYDGLYSKYGHSIQSPSFVETYALMNRTGGETVFNPNYWVVLMRQGAISEHEAKAAHDRLMNTKLNQMINAGSIGTNSSVDSVIKELNITDPYQREWLNDNPNKAILFKKLIEEDKKAQSDLEIGNTPGGGLNLGGSGSVFQSLIPDLKDEIKEGALITKKIEEIGITNIDQKRFLYDNNAQRKNIFEFVNNSKISGNIPNEVNLFTKEAVSTLINSNSSEEEKKAIKLTIKIENANLLENYNTAHFNIANQYMTADLTDPVINSLWYTYFTAKCAILSFYNPTWSKWKVYWKASEEMIHYGLDVGGMVPVVGEVCDITNGVIYTIKGDGVNATLSFSAAIPLIGWGATASKYAYKVVQYSINGTRTRLVFKVLENGKVYFGSTSNKLRKVLGITDASKHAHHLIPWGLRDFDLVQKAAKSKHAFHINEALNGIPRLKSLHLKGHKIYNDKIQDILIRYSKDNRTLSNEKAFNFIEGLANHIRDIIKANPNLNSGQIAELINYY